MEMQVPLEPAPPMDVVVLCADEGARETLAYWLKSSGVATAVAGSGYQARNILRGGLSRLLITDRILPPWPGLDTVVNLKQTLVGLTVAFLDDGVPDNRTLARSAGADIILPRPLRRAHVMEAFVSSDPNARGLACAS